MRRRIAPLRTAGLSLLVLALAATCSPASADGPLQIYAAGSLKEAMTAMLAASGLRPEDLAEPVYGPAGSLRARIEGGAPADVFASADLQQPERLAKERGGRAVVIFAYSRMCALARGTLGLTPANLLDRMLDPRVRLATSTPGADPGGDYALAVFARAELLHPGAQASLQAKALKPFGGPDAKPPVPGRGAVEGIFLADRADIVLGYCTGASRVVQAVPGLVAIPLPPGLAVTPTYALVVLDDDPRADRLVVFMVSERGQAILAHYGFTPATTAR